MIFSDFVVDKPWERRELLAPTRYELVLKVDYWGRFHLLPLPSKPLNRIFSVFIILFLLPVLILVLLQEDLFLFLNFRPELLLRREKQLILARKYGLVVRRQCKTHRRVILLGAE